MKTRSQSLAPLNPKEIKVQTCWDSFNKVCSRALQIVWNMGLQVLWNKSLYVAAWCDTGWFSFRLRLPSPDIESTNFGLCEAPVKHTVTQILLNSWNVKSRDPHKACAQIFELRCNEKLANLLSAQSAAQIGAWSLWLCDLAARFQCCGSSSSSFSSSSCSCCCCRFGQTSYESKCIESLTFSKRTTRKTHGDRIHPYPFHSLLSSEKSVQFFNDCSGSSLKQLKLIHTGPPRRKSPLQRCATWARQEGKVFTKLWCWVVASWDFEHRQKKTCDTSSQTS